MKNGRGLKEERAKQGGGGGRRMMTKNEKSKVGTPS